MNRNKFLITIMPLFIFVIAFLLIGDSQAQTTANQTCQIYHLSVEQARIRSCAGDTCPVIGGASQFDTLCIRGVAEDDANWLEIDLNPESDEESQNGFISRTLVIPGPPGTNPEVDAYCDAWEVIPEEVIVRASPTSSSDIVTTLAAGEQICIEDYYYFYTGWSAFVQPATGQTGWVDTSNLRYVYDESLGCEESREVIAAATIHSCAGSGCATASSLAVGARLCLTSETEEEGIWANYIRTDAEGRNGWVRLDLLKPVDQELQAVATEPTATNSLAASCADYLVSSQTPVNIRAEASLNGATIRAVTPGTVVCVVGTAGDLNDWYAVNTTPEEENQTLGYIFGSLLQPVVNTAQQADTGTATEVASAQQQVSIGTPTPLPTLQPLGGASTISICPVGASPVEPGACATVTPTPLPVVQLAGNGLLLARNVSVADLFFTDSIELNSPQSRVQYFFSLPDDWVVREPMTMRLNLNYNETIAALNDPANPQLNSQLTIRLNNEIVSFVNFNINNIGPQILEVPMPVRLLRPTSNLLEFTLNAVDYCNINAQANLSISGESSVLTFVYEESLPVIDLAYYPRPFFNDPLRTDTKTLWLVLPDAPSDAELSALASVAGGLGALTSNRLNLRVAGVSELTPEIWRENHFIVIGRPDSNALVADLYQRNLLPSSYNGSQLAYNGSAIEADDGVVQLIAHPDNPARAIMVVTAQSEEGLLKAGQSLAGPPSLLNLTGDIAVVFETRAVARIAPQAEDNGLAPALYTLLDLGITDDIVLTGAGSQTATIEFRLPLGGSLREDAYIELLFSSSTILSTQDSSLNILVNGSPIAGVVLDDARVGADGVQQTGFRRMRASIPASAVAPGLNEITLLADMKGNWGCNLPDAEVIWTTVSRDSKIFLPQNSVPFTTLFQTVGQFPIPFNVLANLEDLVIQMPEVPSKTDLQQLARLMNVLGASNPLAEGLRPLVNRGSFPEGTDLANYNFIVIGRPTTNQFLRDLNPNLPQPFVDGTDDFQQIYDDVSYRLLPGLNVGLLQILPSPWNNARSIFVISGATEEGQISAMQALFDPLFSSDLFGNIVFTTDTDVTAVDTRFVFTPVEILDAIPELAGIAQLVPQPATATPDVAVLVITATPQPTQLTTTPVIVTATPEATLIFTPTPADAFTTPLPAVQPLTQEAIQQSIQVDRPQWVSILIGISVVLVAVALLYNMVVTIWNRGKKDE